MSLPAQRPPENERANSAEYLKEYGGLVIDVSTLIETLSNTLPNVEDEETFSVESIDGPLNVPQQILDAIGPVTSADITYGHYPGAGITVELFGKDKTYYMNRYPDSDEVTDAVFDIKPVDDIDAMFLSKTTRQHNIENSEAFEQRIKNIPGIGSVDFTKLLVSLAQPSLSFTYGTDEADSINAVDAFSPAVHDALVLSTRTSSSLRHGFTEYHFLADDTAKLFYAYEYGQPSSFHFQCEDQTGDTLQFRGSIHKAIDLEFPRHAVGLGMNNDIVDMTRSFPLTLKEIKYIREIFSDETKSIPSDDSIEITSFDADQVQGASVDTAVIEVHIDNEREEARIQASAQLGWLNAEYTQLLDNPEDTSQQ